jgi:HlyD family secretion protein
MRAVTRFVLAGLALLLVGGGVWYFWGRHALAANRSAAERSFTQVVEVRQGNLNATLSVVGELDAVQRVDLSFEKMKGAAWLVTLDARPGNTVQAGQLLATIDPAPYQQALDQARSDLQAAEERLAELTAPVTELAKAKSDLAIARAELKLAQAQDALEDLLKPNIADLQTKAADAQTALAKAQADLVALETDKSVEDRMTRLRDAEAKAAAEYSRLANETYSDAYYQDRLQIAFNALMNAQDSRVTAEVQQQVDILKAQMQVAKARAGLGEAQAALAEAQAGADRLTLAKAQLAVREAEVALASARSDRGQLTQGPAAVTLAAAQADVDKKRLAQADAQAALAGARLAAPFDGTILQTYAPAGSQLTANTRVLTLANLKSLQVLASVDETAIRRVAVGQPAQVTFDALPGRTLRGQVTAVPLQGALQGGVTVYEVPIALSGAQELPLLVGMTANVQIQVGQAANALLVPAMALQRRGNSYQVLVPNAADPAAPQAVAVEVGLSDGVNTQIVRGLSLGDKVLVQLQASQSNTFNMPGMGGPMPGGGQTGGQQRSQPAGR